MRVAIAVVLGGMLGCLPPGPPPPDYAGQGAPGAAPADPDGPRSTDPAGPPTADPWQAQGPAPGPGAPATPATPTGTAPTPAAGSLAFAEVPREFTQQAGWYIREDVEDRGGSRRVKRGLVRVLPALPASGDHTAALRDQVKRYIPTELQASMSTMVFRRYIGDGRVAQYVHGQGVERGRSGNSWFAAYLIDCGATWQPIITAATYDEAPEGAGFAMNVGFALPQAMDLVEPLLSAVRCDGARNQPFVAAADLAGHYYFGSGASMDYVHVLTGASSTQFVSYSGDYDLRADGTAAYRYSSASNLGAGTNFAGEQRAGTWRVEGDLVTISLNGRQPKVMRIAGLHTFPDARIAVLIDPASAATPTRVGDPRDFYTTKPR